MQEKLEKIIFLLLTVPFYFEKMSTFSLEDLPDELILKVFSSVDI